MEPGVLEPSIFLAWAADVGPGLPPWINTAAYLWLAMACIWARIRGRGPTGRLGSTVWLGLALMLATLAAARAFGLQSMLTGTFRELAREEGWYTARREFQARVVLAAAALASLTPVAIAVRARSTRMILAFTPVAALLGFLAVRAVSFHYVDEVLYRRVGGVEISSLVELTLLVLVAAGLGLLASGRRGDAPGAVADRDGHLGVRRYKIR
jgi:hypothetical protein